MERDDNGARDEELTRDVAPEDEDARAELGERATDALADGETADEATDDEEREHGGERSDDGEGEEPEDDEGDAGPLRKAIDDLFAALEDDLAGRGRALTILLGTVERHREKLTEHGLGARLKELTESVRALRAEPDWEPEAVRAKRVLLCLAADERLVSFRGELRRALAQLAESARGEGADGPPRWTGAVFGATVLFAAGAAAFAWTRDVYGPTVEGGFSWLVSLAQLLLALLSGVGLGAAVARPVREMLERVSQSTTLRLLGAAALLAFGSVNVWAASARVMLDVRCEPGASYAESARLTTAREELVACGARVWVQESETVFVRAPEHESIQASAAALRDRLASAQGLLELQRLPRITADLGASSTTWSAEAPVSLWCSSRKGLSPIAHYQYTIVVSDAYERSDGDSIVLIEPDAIRAAATLRALMVRDAEHRCSHETSNGGETLTLPATRSCFPPNVAVIADVFVCAPAPLAAHERVQRDPRVEYRIASTP